jgi:hypothetical protein
MRAAVSGSCDHLGVRTRRVILKCISEPIQVRETAFVDLPRAGEAVWAWMVRAHSSVELFDSTEVGVTLPGSPEGVGEIQAFVARTPEGRSAGLLEVVELEPGRRAVTRDLASPFRSGGVLTIAPLGENHCRLTQELWADLPVGTAVATVHAVRDAQKEQLRHMMLRLSELTIAGSI